MIPPHSGPSVSLSTSSPGPQLVTWGVCFPLQFYFQSGSSPYWATIFSPPPHMHIFKVNHYYSYLFLNNPLTLKYLALVTPLYLQIWGSLFFILFFFNKNKQAFSYTVNVWFIFITFLALNFFLCVYNIWDLRSHSSGKCMIIEFPLTKICFNFLIFCL